MHPIIIHLTAQERTRDLLRVADHARRDPMIRRTRRTTIATPRLFARRAPRSAAA